MGSPDLLEKLAAYVPMPVLEAIYHQPRPLTHSTSRRFPAVVLYTDISGFTPLSELLGQAGPTGAEELTHLVNQYFTRMIQVVQAYHGQVVKFSGDFGKHRIELDTHPAPVRPTLDEYELVAFHNLAKVTLVELEHGVFPAGEIMDTNMAVSTVSTHNRTTHCHANV